MTLPKWWPLAALALVCAGIVWFAHYERQQGRNDQQIADAQHQERPIIDTIRVRDSLFVHDTVRLTVVRHRTDSMLRVDTLIRSDTVQQWIRAERNACDTVIRDCEARVAARDSLNANLRQQIKLLEKRKPSRLTCVLGAAANNDGIGLGGACGVRLF